MDHGGHGGHDGHDMPTMARCKMNMLWNTDIIDTCIVFKSWHIRTSTGFLLSCLAIVALGVLYEYLRGVQRDLDKRIALSLAAGKAKGRERSRTRDGDSGQSEGNVATLVDVEEVDSEEAGLLTGRRALKSSLTGTPVPPVSRALRAAVYGATVFLSFFLMLVFMTYNAYLIFATVLGAALGHYIFGATINVDAILSESSGGKGMACH
ncbi:Copper transport protein ctr6 [Psilocybe cubensis]|uniref:Copper transport protein n=2 Tax=Psilocybe cubensis TaxID=181762 RepID=A0A8H7Y3R5_PSICU|nr:Copper transport protein ctr6 [Psilocybe cubensis]KAH9484858.1 Copper transport protein ctr6 [Psilocybe cubensis]